MPSSAGVPLSWETPPGGLLPLRKDSRALRLRSLSTSSASSTLLWVVTLERTQNNNTVSTLTRPRLVFPSSSKPFLYSWDSLSHHPPASSAGSPRASPNNEAVQLRDAGIAWREPVSRTSVSGTYVLLAENERWRPGRASLC